MFLREYILLLYTLSISRRDYDNVINFVISFIIHFMCRRLSILRMYLLRFFELKFALKFEIIIIDDLFYIALLIL